MSARHISVIGAGAWGIALACHAQRLGANVSLWARTPQLDRTKRNLPRLPSITLPHEIELTNHVPNAADVTLVAVPTQSLRALAQKMRGSSPLILCCKGIEKATGCLPAEILAEIFPGRTLGILSGPNFALEIAQGKPAAATLAMQTLDKATKFVEILSSSTFRLYASADMIGVQIAGAAKNVVAIGAGIAIGAGFGENARAALITRAIVEIGRLAERMGGETRTIAGLSGMGDLILTCTSAQSRNYSLGISLGQGRNLSDLIKEGGSIIEGVTTAPILLDVAERLDVDVPIIRTVAGILTKKFPLSMACGLLLERPSTTE